MLPARVVELYCIGADSGNSDPYSGAHSGNGSSRGRLVVIEGHTGYFSGADSDNCGHFSGVASAVILEIILGAPVVS